MQNPGAGTLNKEFLKVFQVNSNDLRFMCAHKIIGTLGDCYYNNLWYNQLWQWLEDGCRHKPLLGVWEDRPPKLPTRDNRLYNSIDNSNHDNKFETLNSKTHGAQQCLLKELPQQSQKQSM